MSGAGFHPVPLRHRSRGVVGHALVDLSDAALVAAHTWHLHSGGYAVRWVTEDGKRTAIFLHREILGFEHGDRSAEADHVNGNKLDNRRANLRRVTHAENMQNRPSHAGSRSRFRGVYWAPDQKRWRAEARLSGQKHHIGYFASEEEAGSAAASWRAAHMPFASERAA